MKKGLKTCATLIWIVGCIFNILTTVYNIRVVNSSSIYSKTDGIMGAVFTALLYTVLIFAVGLIVWLLADRHAKKD
ncbi:MAG: hypothetical protein LBU60_00080 [Clostridiales bacterium]|nr:hypothetical protein [Clostridiales bacterium]